MPRKTPLSIEHLWQMQRIGSPSIAPDGGGAVAAVTRYSMKNNTSQSTLWLFPIGAGEPRPLTRCGDKDGQPRWSPRGDRVAFLAKREQEGCKDDSAQLYVIAPDGGEARRVTTVHSGIEAFRWCPDGRHILCVSWVKPGLKGARAQERAARAFRERKETGYVTSEHQYRYWDHFIPMDRVPHLLYLNIDTGKYRDLFEGSAWELPWAEPGANDFDISPDGKRVVFVCDPARHKKLDNPKALAEIKLGSGDVRLIACDSDWDLRGPRYSPDGGRVAFTAQHFGLKHTMPDQLALWERKGNNWSLQSGDWDREVQVPLAWEADGSALLFTAEERGRQHLWRFDLGQRVATIVARGGHVQAFDHAGTTLVTLVDALDHPPQLRVQHGPGEPCRLETFNDTLMNRILLGHSEERWYTGAGGDQVQLWLTYPPDMECDAGSPKKRTKKKSKQTWPLLHLIHGGPHSAFGDVWHFRWNVQAFAAMGYVVAAVNYHGSSGFGYAFKDSITHRWGELELADVEAATDLLLEEPWADERRVFAAGGSYGGFMVAWMNGHVKPGRYAACVCHAGCFDWTAMLADDAYTWHARELGAWYWDDMAKVHSQSPHAFAANMRTPTLVVHGALDYRVPDAQGLAYYNTLKARDVDARLLWFPDENHWVLKPRNSRLWYREFGDWLARYDTENGSSVD